MDTEHLSGDERAGCRIRVPQASRHRMTSAPAQMQWLDLKWRLQRGVWLMLLRHTFNWGRGQLIFYQKFILVRAAHLPQLISILSGYFWRIKTLFVSLYLISHLSSQFNDWMFTPLTISPSPTSHVSPSSLCLDQSEASLRHFSQSEDGRRDDWQEDSHQGPPPDHQGYLKSFLFTTRSFFTQK